MPFFHTCVSTRALTRWAFWAGLIVVLILALLPSSSPILPSTSWDKANHALAFAALGLLAHIAYSGRIVSALLGLLAFGGLIEILQSFTPSRSAEWADLLADAVGLAVAAGLMQLIKRLKRCRQKNNC